VSAAEDEQQQRTRPRADSSLAAVLTAALADRRMSLTQLRAALERRGQRVSLATLSYWRSGQRRPESLDSLDTLREIELILGLPEGRLRQSRGPSRRPGPRPPYLAAGELVPADVPVDAALADLELSDWGERLAEDVVHLAVDLDEHGASRRATCHTMLRALQDGARHYPLFIFAGEPLPTPIELEELRGARVTGQVVDDAVGLAMWRLTLPRPLDSGETALLETRLGLPDTGRPDPDLTFHAVRRLSEVTVWVRFDPARLPTSCELLVEGDDGTERRTPVDVGETHSAHVTVRRFGPGRVGVVLGWD
jgi:hypothetical protein